MSTKLRKVIARSRPIQGELELRERHKHGGRRVGSGRKRKDGQHDSRHRMRPELKPYHPVHVVMRVKKGVGRLRKGDTYRAIRKSLVRCLGNEAFRVCHVSIQNNHLHFLVEASDRKALACGMQRLNNLSARAINRALGRRGSVFAFRYHATQIKSPKQARHCLAYVLNNWRRHSEDETSERAHNARLDPYASGLAFDGWTMRFAAPSGFTPLSVDPPRSWLLTAGWRRHRPIDPFEIPGPLP